VSFEDGVDDLVHWLRTLPEQEVARSVETFARLEAQAEAKGYTT
jgi:hypothetical protein